MLTILFRQGPTSRVQLAKQLGLSKAALTSLVGELVDLELLVEEVGTAVRGRPPTLLRANPGRYASIGVDVRIDRIQMVALSLDDVALETLILPVPPEPTPQGLTDGVSDGVRTLIGALDRQALGIGFAMPARRAELGVDHEIWGWRAVPMRDHFVSMSQGLPHQVLDLAEAACVANSTQKELAGCERVLHVQVGAGVTMALAVGGQLDLQLPRRWGRIGHAPLGDENLPCACGKRGCLDATVGMAAVAGRLPHIQVPDGPRLISRIASRIGEAAAGGDRLASEVVARAQWVLARAIAVLTEVLAPDAITLGGYPLFMGPEFVEDLDGAVASLLSHGASVTASPLGDETPTLGAALIGREIGTADPAALR